MEWKHRGRIITPADITFIQQLIEANPGLSRRKLSAKLCEAWDWKQANGALRDMVCRGMLLMLDRAGQIQLPAIKKRPNNPLARRPRPAPVLIDTTPIQGALKPLQPLQIEQVRRTGDEKLYNSLIEQHHYLSYEQPVGEHLKYVVWSQGRPIACMAWSSAPRHLGCRDRFIGWDSQARRRNIRFIAYNTRFLIVPWVQVPHLASHILGRIAQRGRRTGKLSTPIRSISWRRSWTRSASGEPVTVPPIGCCLGKLQAGGKPIKRNVRTGRSNSCWPIR